MVIDKTSVIYPDLLFAVKSSSSDAYNEGLDRLTNLDYLVDFMTKNASYLDNEVWQAAGFSSTAPYKAAEYVLNEAYDMDDDIITRCENVDAGKLPDLDGMFHYLDGQYKDMVELTPMKAYGGKSPAFIRLYALKIDSNCYLVIYMGIKLAKKISESPELKDEVVKRLDQSIRYLKEKGIIDREGLKEDSQ